MDNRAPPVCDPDNHDIPMDFVVSYTCPEGFVFETPELIHNQQEQGSPYSYRVAFEQRSGVEFVYPLRGCFDPKMVILSLRITRKHHQSITI